MKILLLDDEPDFLEQAEVFLEREDESLEVETAVSAKEGLELLEENDYDAIVSDYQMPGMDGLDFLGTIREERNSDIPFIIFTGKGREEVAIEALNLGADRYLQKGGDPKSQYGVLAQTINQEVKHKRTEERFERLFYGLGEPAFLTIDEEIIVANDKACEKTGYSREELTGMNIVDDLTAGEEAEKQLSKRKKKLDKTEQIRFESTLKTKDGSILQVEVTSSPIEYRGQRANISINRDTTEREKEEKKLRAYRSATESSGDSIYMVDKDYRYILANEEHLSRLSSVGHISEVDESEVVGRKIHDIFPREIAEKFYKSIDEVFETGESRKEISKGARDESWSSRTISPVEDPKTGEVEAVVIISEDVTARRKAEEREEFLHSLLRHDVRNKNQIVQGYLELLKDTNLSEEQKKLVEKAMKGSRNGTDIIEKVRTLREVEEEEKIGETSVGPVIKNMISEWESQASEKGISIEYEDCEYKVRGGPLLEELFSNLVENSIAHSDCGKIWVSSEETEGECIVTVEDDGCGISDEDKDKIFDRGFKKGETPGTGLGAYLVKEIAESYGGEIEVKDSELGGARFDVHLQKA